MNKTIKEQLDKMENRLDEALDNALFHDSEFDMDDFQSEVCSFERELNEILEFNREHLQFPELEKICSVQKKIKQVKEEYEFYDPEDERSVMFPNGEDEEAAMAGIEQYLSNQ